MALTYPRSVPRYADTSLCHGGEGAAMLQAASTGRPLNSSRVDRDLLNRSGYGFLLGTFAFLHYKIDPLSLFLQHHCDPLPTHNLPLLSRQPLQPIARGPRHKQFHTTAILRIFLHFVT
jgi:hypothetical protein